MSQFVFSHLNQTISHYAKPALLVCTLLGTTQFAVAGQAVDQLSECLVKSTTAADKTTVLQWTFTALAQHPDLKTFAHVTDEQKTALDKNLAQTLQRILTEQCSTQAQAVIKAEGLQAVGESFQELGSITGEEILKTPEIKQQLNGVLKYIDLNKLVVTFLTPDIWNKLGVVRDK
ncbi:hypothetical protein HX005_02630 [Acinetobacter sp. R933-2]|uniref:hypothetical protein n=1 Tax=Acinetobacter TaxID=469 RepID=UPI0025776957|nr:MULTISPECIES: hypothetical protein [Acinetobacter]MDM1246290.1 hypothetical protein [Acinetobacter sp. R933-2]MDQ9020003.1 hypothetical protein [Acinetobacter sichuanensis]